jgi:hypothetical protein
MHDASGSRNADSAAEYYTFLFPIQRTRFSLVRLTFESTSRKVNVPTSQTNTDSAAALSYPHLQKYLE